MKFGAFFLVFFYLYNVLLVRFGIGAMSTPPPGLPNNVAINKFQSALQQQNIYTILASIEERLRNLDNVYALQLSQSLESKLNQYNRHLENLDSKIIRLEALVMLNLDKISENISTKNFKDDISRTSTQRKMDSLYEGISHRLSYMDRKYEASFDKIQEKMDIVASRLDKMEEKMSKRDADLEAEISDAIFSIDELKSSCANMEGQIVNLTTSAFNMTKEGFNMLTHYNVEARRSMNKLHDNIVGNLQYMDNKTSEHLRLSRNSNALIKEMKNELKGDFNSYAAKVADMNSDVWKHAEKTENDLMAISTVLNGSKVEFQNGVRSLMLQIGKISLKDNEIQTNENQYEDITKILNSNFEKILTNQDVFLQSCHRLQMDESQIESEISNIMEKLIDLLETKMNSDPKDFQDIGRIVRRHDIKLSQYTQHLNANLAALYKNLTLENGKTSESIQKINDDINALFSFVQATLTHPTKGCQSEINAKAVLAKLNAIENETNTNLNILKNNFVHIMYDKLINVEQKTEKILQSIWSNKKNPEVQTQEKMINETKIPERAVLNIFPLSKNTTYPHNPDLERAVSNIFPPAKNTTDPHNPDLERAVSNIFPPPKNRTSQSKALELDANSLSSAQKPNSELTPGNPSLKNAISNIFPPPKPDINASRPKNDTQSTIIYPINETSQSKSRCPTNYRQSIDIRGDFKSNCDGDIKHRRSRKRHKYHSRLPMYDLHVRSEFDTPDSSDELNPGVLDEINNGNGVTEDDFTDSTEESVDVIARTVENPIIFDETE